MPSRLGETKPALGLAVEPPSADAEPNDVGRRLAALFSTESPLWNGHREDQDQLIASLLRFLRSSKVSSGVPEDRLKSRFPPTTVPDQPIDFERYLEGFVEALIDHSINVASPRCLGHMSGPVGAYVHRLGEVVTGLNQNLVKRESSRVLTLVERQTIGMMHHAVYGRSAAFYERRAHESESTLGMMASGGTLANITAIWCARNESLGPTDDGFQGVEHDGWLAAFRHHGYDDAVIISSALGHYSVDKAAGVLGLGTRRVIKVAVDCRGRMSIAGLEEAIRECARRRWKVIAIVGLAGATDTGSIDPLDEMADVAEREAIHLHVDACWTAPLILSQRYRPRLAGIERADSVAIDGHKQLYLPLGTSMLLLRDPGLAESIRKEAPYMLRHGSGDQGRFTLEGSRAGMALFFHAALHLVARSGFDELVAAGYRRASDFARRVRARTGFELVLEPDTNIVLYRYLPSELRDRATRQELGPDETRRVNAFNERLQDTQFASGKTFVSRTRLQSLPQLDGEPVICLRAVLSNPRTRSADLEAVLEDQARIAAALELAEARRRGAESGA